MTTAVAPETNLQLDTLISDALELRRGLVLPSIEHGPVVIVELLVEVRSRLDRLEEILSQVTRFRTVVRTRHKQAQAAYDDRWASHVTPSNGRRRTASDGWSGAAPRERYAEADLAALDEKRALRQVDILLDQVNDAVEVIKQAHRGLDSTRQDLHLLMRSMTIEAALER